MKRWIFLIKILLVILMLVFIWGHSVVNADMSSAQSEYFLALVRPLVQAVQRLLENGGVYVEESLLVRKMAHFSEYAVLGVLTFLLFASEERLGGLALPAAISLGVALIDEGIQHFAAGRGPSLRDVGIDFCGACMGILVTAAILTVVVQLTLRSRREERE